MRRAQHVIVLVSLVRLQQPALILPWPLASPLGSLGPAGAPTPPNHTCTHRPTCTLPLGPLNSSGSAARSQKATSPVTVTRRDSVKSIRVTYGGAEGRGAAGAITLEQGASVKAQEGIP